MDGLTRRQREFLAVLGFQMLEHDRPQSAAKIYHALAVCHPDDVYYSRCHAFALLRAGEFDQAVTAAEAGLAKDASAADRDFLHLVRSRALWRLGRREEAQLAFQGVMARRRGTPGQ